MTLKEKNNILLRLGIILQHIGEKSSWPGYEIGINESEYQNLEELVQKVHIYNGWFKDEQVRKSLQGIASWLTEESLNNWQSQYSLKDHSDKKVAIIMAGNIPLVGFHDFISVFLSGHKAIVKMSSEDKHLFPAILNIMALFDERIWERVELIEEAIRDFDAVIATGSDNSARYFETYFGKYPSIIRKNRTSIAVLTGKESKEDFYALGKDIFDYFGLGCRNVSQIWIPKDFNLNLFFEGIYEHNEIIHHNKYANNYDYNKAVFLMNQETLLDNGFILLKEERSLYSPLAVLHYQRYNDKSEVEQFIKDHADQIQVVVGAGYLPFGQTQLPRLMDYADGVDTMAFLTEL
ncbi:MAG: acyl-CoA reductase [Crocinitomicaceae bacterium]|nr:acyl-CoA reductase [Crocinitomicaceae bacterium]